jgi:hypothetical protein
MSLVVSYEMLAVRAQMRELAEKLSKHPDTDLRRLYGNPLRNRSA